MDDFGMIDPKKPTKDLTVDPNDMGHWLIVIATRQGNIVDLGFVNSLQSNCQWIGKASIRRVVRTVLRMDYFTWVGF